MEEDYGLCQVLPMQQNLQSPLTGMSLMVHVKLAAGRECLEVQLPRTISPTLYLARSPDKWGRESGTSVVGGEGKGERIQTN